MTLISSRPSQSVIDINDARRHIDALWRAIEEIKDQFAITAEKSDIPPIDTIPPEAIGEATVIAGSFTDNDPSAGSVSWNGVQIRYNGNTYGIINGNTALKYIYWSSSDTSNLLSTDDLEVVKNSNNNFLIGVNNGGVFQNYVGRRLAVNTVNATSIVDSSITTPKIANFAIQPQNMNNTHIYIPGSPFSITGTTISWTAFTLYYNGAAYSISGGSSSYKYIYWTIGNANLSGTDGWIEGGNNQILLVYRISTGILYTLYNKRTSFAQDFVDGSAIRDNTIPYQKLIQYPSGHAYVIKSANTIFSSSFSTTGFYNLFSFASNISGEDLPYLRLILPYKITVSNVNEGLVFYWRLKLVGNVPSYYHQSLNWVLARDTAGVGSATVGEAENANGMIIGGHIYSGDHANRFGGVVEVTIDGHVWDRTYQQDTNIALTCRNHLSLYNTSDTWIRSESWFGGGTMRGYLNSRYAVQIGLDVIIKTGTATATVNYSYTSYSGIDVDYTKPL